ncbi:50S ribosomal protein L11 methyltransferase [Sphingomicrobium astaxanthinifaciens]|uniref:50S ribosomal protein L11 methyltransferase n=1 Tax=Sphingomicrobium astaxanthinifaciens TaxID=1227949 RepID=UPI001FCA8807|nr:50S ribosomal protein L11 methyltransferase [Sphingomicrobium astaxanthinifaciens]MCJ7421502.1 50S ribosomal protein L11 methyltransferase [Sphingomicrobium astaxanthinifaciens]
MSWRVTLPCTKAEAERIADSGDELFALHDTPPVLSADEPDEDKPDEWRLRAYFEEQPSTQDLILLRRLAPGEPVVEHLDEEDWVTMSQAGIEPIRAGRFYVHTPHHPADEREGVVDFTVEAGLAFGTGQHATTAGCLEAIDRLGSEGRRFSNIADIGTGTGLLAFAALRLWPEARIIASDIDPVAIEVAEDNASRNHIPTGEGAGHVLLLTAPGLGHPLIANAKPFDLLIANILAGPLIDLAPGFAAALAPGGTMILSGLLDDQADRVAAAYTAQGLDCIDRGTGEWRVLRLERPA